MSSLVDKNLGLPFEIVLTGQNKKILNLSTRETPKKIYPVPLEIKGRSSDVQFGPEWSVYFYGSSSLLVKTIKDKITVDGSLSIK